MKDPIQDVEWKVGETSDSGQVNYNIDQNTNSINIVGIKAGTVTIKATSKINPNKSHSIIIVVKDVPTNTDVSNS